MFIFERPWQAVAAGLAVATLMVCLDQLSEQDAAAYDRAPLSNATQVLVPRPFHAVSSAPVRDLSLSCRLPPASFASWLPSLKSRIVPDQVAAACTDDSTDLKVSAPAKSVKLQEFDCMTKIYVGNLPFSATDAEVRELFAQHGTVESVSIITDRDTGRPRGFGFVEMSRADASRAIQNLNGKELGGRPLRVNEAQERTGGGGGNRGGGAPKRW
jgi:RNA recognition motif-containing protein